MPIMRDILCHAFFPCKILNLLMWTLFALQTLDIIRFREHLARESEQNLRTTYPELLQMCKDRCAPPVTPLPERSDCRM